MTDPNALHRLFRAYRLLARVRSTLRLLLLFSLASIGGCGAAAVSRAADAYVVRAAKALDEGELDDAEATLRLALELAPDGPEAHADLGLVLSLRGQFDEAADEFARAIVLAPDLAVAHLGLGNVRAATGDLAGAESAYVAALRIQPELVEARRNLVRLLVRAERLEAARAHAMRLVQLAPTVPGDVASLVYLELRLGRPVAARSRLDRALGDLGPSDELAFVDALLRAVEGDAEAALAILARLHAHPTLGPDALARSIALLVDLGRRDEAARVLGEPSAEGLAPAVRAALEARLDAPAAERAVITRPSPPRRGLDPARTARIP